MKKKTTMLKFIWADRLMVTAIMTESQLKKIDGIDNYTGKKPVFTKIDKKSLYNNGEYIIGGKNFGYDLKMFKDTEKLAKSLDECYEIFFPDIPCPCAFKCENRHTGKPIYVILAPRVNDDPSDFEWSESVGNLIKRLGVVNEKH